MHKYMFKGALENANLNIVHLVKTYSLDQEFRSSNLSTAQIVTTEKRCLEDSCVFTLYIFLTNAMSDF